MPQERNIEDFKEFARRAVREGRSPQSEQSYRNQYGRVYRTITHRGYTKEEINEILQSGIPEQVRELSRFLYRYSGEYARLNQYYSTLLNYSYIIVPHYDVDKPPKKQRLQTSFKKTSQYLKDLNLSYNFQKINQKIFQDGVYFGILVETDKNQSMFYQLPTKFCRTRFNDENGLPIVEINLNYFDEISYSEQERREILSLFPKSVQALYKMRAKKNAIWAEIVPKNGGMCFFFSDDLIPPFVSASDSISDLQSARQRETQRDENELHKLLIQKLPIDKADGELLFSLEEAAVLHDSVSNMVADQGDIDVITTYAEIDLKDIQSADDAASAALNRLGKYKNSVYDEFGTTSAIFNPDSGSTAIVYSVKKDVSLMYAWSKQYELWINTWLKTKAKNDQLYYSINILPTTAMFAKEDVDLYLKTAQYGFPKSALAGSVGMDVMDLVNLSDFENNVLKLTEIMVPLSSSYTQTGTGNNSNKQENNSGKSSAPKDITNEGGRPNLPISERSDKTSANIDSMG